MGIFNFFRKKSKRTIESSTSEISSNELDHPDSTPRSGKSINDLYAEQLKNKIPDQPAPNENGIEIVLDDQGSHGDNFGGLLGFGYLHSQRGTQFLNEMVALTAIKASVLENPIVSIKETGFEEVAGDSDRIKIRAITKNGNVSNGAILSAYPYLKTDYVLPFTTKKIIEWSHIAKLEAEIQGGGRDTFGLSFFATDYAVNKSRYKSAAKHNIKISGIGLVLDKSDLTEINGTKISDGFAAYLPNKDIPRPTYYDFIGVLNSYQECKISNENAGYLLNIKLISQEDDPDFFTIDMFINKENMRTTELTKGMKITGAVWFQGEIA